MSQDLSVSERSVVPRWKRGDGGASGGFLEDETRYDPDHARFITHRRYSVHNAPPVEVQFSVRAYATEELRTMLLATSGFDSVEFRDERSEPFSPHSRRRIAVATKA